MDSRIPPAWTAEGQWSFPLGTDDQGRDILSGVINGMRISLVIGASAVLSEATLSFLGVGLPPTLPSIGSMMRIGNDFLFSGEWWKAIFLGLAARAAGAVDQPARRLAAGRAQSPPEVSRNSLISSSPSPNQAVIPASRAPR